MSEGESEAVDESDEEVKVKKRTAKKGKKPKTGRKDVVAVRETTAQKPIPTSIVKRKALADDAARYVSVFHVQDLYFLS